MVIIVWKVYYILIEDFIEDGYRNFDLWDFVYSYVFWKNYDNMFVGVWYIEYYSIMVLCYFLDILKKIGIVIRIYW